MKVKAGQSLFDVVIQGYGDIEQFFVMLKDNFLTPNYKLNAGQDISFQSNIGNEEIKDYISLQDLTLNNFQSEALPPVLAGDFNDDYSNDFS